MTYPNCTNTLRAAGKSYPRTCQECGLGPCKAEFGAAENRPAEAFAYANHVVNSKLAKAVGITQPAASEAASIAPADDLPLPSRVGTGISGDVYTENQLRNYGAQQRQEGRRDMHEVNVTLVNQNDKLREKIATAQGMADCMDMVRQELVEAGVIESNVAPMFVANAVMAWGLSLRQRAEKAESDRDIAVQALRIIWATDKGASGLTAHDALDKLGLFKRGG